MLGGKRYADGLTDDCIKIYESPLRALASAEEIEAAKRSLAELVVEAMDALIAAEEWHPRDGIAGLERALAADDADDTMAL